MAKVPPYSQVKIDRGLTPPDTDFTAISTKHRDFFRPKPIQLGFVVTYRPLKAVDREFYIGFLDFPDFPGIGYFGVF